jgi:hypothetical protein
VLSSWYVVAIKTREQQPVVTPIGNVRLNQVPGISKADGGGNKASGGQRMGRHKLAIGQARLRIRGEHLLNSNNMLIRGEHLLNSSNLPIRGEHLLSNNLIRGEHLLNSSNLPIRGEHLLSNNLILNSNNLLTLGKLLLLLLQHLRIHGDNSKQPRPNSPPGVRRQIHLRLSNRVNKGLPHSVPAAHHLQAGVNLNKLIPGEVRRRHQSHNLLACRLRVLLASHPGSKVVLVRRELGMRVTKLCYARQDNQGHKAA